MFKSIDEKFRDLGFIKIIDNNLHVRYERINDYFEFIHVIEIIHKKNGKHIIQSYDKELHDSKGIGNTCVGLTYYETKLVLKKMKQKGWKSK